MKILTLLMAVLVACAVYGAYTNNLTSGGIYIKKGAQAIVVLNIDNSSGVYDTAQLSFDTAVVTSNGTSTIVVNDKRSRQYALLDLLGYNTNLWTNVVNLLFYQRTP